jgi:hypothetical protein
VFGCQCWPNPVWPRNQVGRYLRYTGRDAEPLEADDAGIFFGRDAAVMCVKWENGPQGGNLSLYFGYFSRQKTIANPAKDYNDGVRRRGAVPRANVYQRVLDERFQTPASRRELFKKVSTSLAGRSVVTFFTSSQYPVEINDGDCDMLQSVVQQTDLARGLVLMINSLGGDTLAAERIVNICRAYSGTGEFWALVPGRAKSAATIICMGASKIIVAPPPSLAQSILKSSGKKMAKPNGSLRSAW